MSLGEYSGRETGFVLRYMRPSNRRSRADTLVLRYMRPGNRRSRADGPWRRKRVPTHVIGGRPTANEPATRVGSFPSPRRLRTSVTGREVLGEATEPIGPRLSGAIAHPAAPLEGLTKLSESL